MQPDSKESHLPEKRVKEGSITEESVRIHKPRK
jgi:hypothetical protein